MDACVHHLDLGTGHVRAGSKVTLQRRAESRTGRTPQGGRVQRAAKPTLPHERITLAVPESPCRKRRRRQSLLAPYPAHP
eukprot:901583-Rhodomonas_salina.1